MRFDSIPVWLYSEKPLAQEVSMTIDRAARLIAGAFVLVSIVLSHLHHPAWLFFTGFVALNLMQSAFTNWCPMMAILKFAGVRSCEHAALDRVSVSAEQKV
jgi:hypothetical protein